MNKASIDQSGSICVKINTVILSFSIRLFSLAIKLHSGSTNFPTNLLSVAIFFSPLMFSLLFQVWPRHLHSLRPTKQ